MAQNKQKYLDGFPYEVVKQMITNQMLQGNPRSRESFEKNPFGGKAIGCFLWGKSPEGDAFWTEVIGNRNFSLFFEKYPKPLHDIMDNFRNAQQDARARILFGD